MDLATNPMTEVERKRLLVLATNIAVEKFKTLLNKSVPLSTDENGFPRFYDDSEILQAAELAKSTVVSNFKEKMQPEKEEVIAVRLDSLDAFLETILLAHIAKNDACRINMKQKIGTLVQEFATAFEEQLHEFHRDPLFDDLCAIKENHEVIKSNVLQAWKTKEKPGNLEFQIGYEYQLENEIDTKSKGYLDKHQQRLTELEENGNKRVEELGKTFEEKLLAKPNEIQDLERWEAFCDRTSRETLDKFIMHENTFPMGHSKHDLLNEKLSNVFESVRVNVLMIRMVSWYRQFVDENLVNYVVSMEMDLHGKDCVSEQDLHSIHATAKEKTVQQFSNLDKYRIPNKAAEFKLNLESKISRAFCIFQEEGKKTNEMLHKNARGLVDICQTEYRKLIKTELEKMHQMHKERVQEMFKVKCPVKSSSTFSLPYVQQVEDFTNEMFQKLSEIVTVTKNVTNPFSDENLNMNNPSTRLCLPAYPDFDMIFNKKANQNLLADESLLDPDKDFGPSVVPKSDFEERSVLQTLKLLVTKYKNEMQRHMDSNAFPDNLEVLDTKHGKLEEVMVSALTKIYMLDRDNPFPEDEILLHTNALTDDLKREFQTFKKLNQEKRARMQGKVNKVVQKMKLQYKENMKQFLAKHSDGLETQLLEQHHVRIKTEVIKLLEMEIRRKVKVDQPTDSYKEPLQNYIDTCWTQLAADNKKRLDCRQKENEAKRILPPLVFHIQSSRVVMAMGIEGKSEIIKNEFGKKETPALVVITPSNQFIYGDQALELVQATPPSRTYGFCCTVADFFTTTDLSWSKLITIAGKEWSITAEFLLGFLLGKLKKEAEVQKKGKCPTTVLAIPFWLSSAQRAKVKDGAKLAGFKEVFLVNETSAAAYNFVLGGMRLRSNEVIVISENLDCVDAFVYLCLVQEKKIAMIGHSSNYEMGEKSKGPVRRFMDVLQHFLLRDLGHDSDVIIGDIRRACRSAQTHATKKINRQATVIPAESVYISENPLKWSVALEIISDEFGNRTGVDIPEDLAVIAGSVALSQNPHEIGNLIRDQPAYDVIGYPNSYGVGSKIKVIYKEDMLPVKSKGYTSRLANGVGTATLFQCVLGIEHAIGELIVQDVRYNQIVEPKIEITNEAIVSLQNAVIKTVTKGGGSNDHPSRQQYMQLNTPNLSENQLKDLGMLLNMI